MIIKLKRVLGHQEGHTIYRVNTDLIQFYYSDKFTQFGRLIDTTRISFFDSCINVLETPQEIDNMIWSGIGRVA